jgi:hypothetical protein
MGKVIKFSVVDGAGAGVLGQKVVAGDSECVTGLNGMAQALLEEGNTVITVNGKKAYEGPVDSLQPLEVFTVSGQRKA